MTLQEVAENLYSMVDEFHEEGRLVISTDWEIELLAEGAKAAVLLQKFLSDHVGVSMNTQFELGKEERDGGS